MVTQPLTSPTPPTPISPALGRKALSQARTGNRPQFVEAVAHPYETTHVYTVVSATGRGVYRVEFVANCEGVHTVCNCQAGDHGQSCWHQVAVALLEDGELPERPASAIVAAHRGTLTADDLWGPRR